jgi:hypothetical protein
MGRSYSEYMDRARAIASEGFTTKQSKKDAIEYVSRAFDCVKRAISDKLLADRSIGGTEERWGALYNGLPDCYAWNAKRAAPFEKLFAAEVAQMNEARSFRDAITAAPMVEKKPNSRKVAELKRREEHALTCQICERGILADTGLIAHHGYERPGDGWQTASCFGARELPFEVSRDVLGVYVASLLDGAERNAKHARDLRAERVACSLDWSVYNRTTGRSDAKSASITRATYAKIIAANPEFLRGKASAPSFDAIKASNIADALRQEKRFREEHKRQKARFDAWTQTLERKGETWQAV